MEEDLYCVLNSMALPGGNMTIQIADKLYALRAPKGQLDDATKLFQTMIHSTQINLQWFNKYAQLVQALTQAQMNRIRAAGELSRYISRTSSEISDMMRQSYEQRQASQDRINKNWSQYMRGVDEYHDPVAGRPVELPSGYNNAWVNGQRRIHCHGKPQLQPERGTRRQLAEVGTEGAVMPLKIAMGFNLSGNNYFGHVHAPPGRSFCQCSKP